MADVCTLNSSKCLYNGECVVNIVLNTTYCQCDECHEGLFCENIVWEAKSFNYIAYVYLIIYLVEICLSILNNGLVLELIILCRRIRKTNSGIYLMIYSIVSFLSSIVLLAHEMVKYYPNQLKITYKRYDIFRCYGSKVGYSTLLASCVFFSSFIAFERALIICFADRMNVSRWRSCATIIAFFGIAIAVNVPLLMNECNFQTPTLKITRSFASWFYMTTGIVVYLLATLLVLITFTRRIRRYGMENNSWTKTFLKLLYTHLFIFVPPIAYLLCQLPYTIVLHTKMPKTIYLVCYKPKKELIIKILMHALTHIPFVVTWLLFVYPSKVYMTEFYLNTWSGQRLANILLLIQSFKNRTESNHLSTSNPTNDENVEWKNPDLCTSEVPRMCERIQTSTQKYIIITYNDIYIERYERTRKYIICL